MTWDDPSTTIATHCYVFRNSRFGHPEQNKAASLREVAIRQPFLCKYALLPSNEKPISLKLDAGLRTPCR